MAEFFRIEKRCNFTVIANECIRDKRLSYKARMLLILMLSVRDDFQITKRWLVQSSDKDGRDSVESGLAELQKYGYLTISRQRNDKGQLMDTLYTIHEEPVQPAAAPEKGAEKPEPENPSLEPEPENPALEKPALENPHYRNTNIRNTIPPIVPQEKERRKGKRTAPEVHRQLMAWAVDKPTDVGMVLDEFVSFCRDDNVQRGHNPLSARGAQILTNKLEKYSGGDPQIMVSLLKNAIEHNWLTVYERKEGAQGKPAPSREQMPSDWGDNVVSL